MEKGWHDEGNPFLGGCVNGWVDKWMDQWMDDEHGKDKLKKNSYKIPKACDTNVKER